MSKEADGLIGATSTAKGVGVWASAVETAKPPRQIRTKNGWMLAIILRPNFYGVISNVAKIFVDAATPGISRGGVE
jgi:hypothetical protein